MTFSELENIEANRIELKSVRKSYGQNVALRDISLHIKNHEVIGLIGENGAGKSTLLKILGGVHAPDEGDIVVDGQKSSMKGVASATALGIGVVHQEQSLIETLSVEENISLGDTFKATDSKEHTSRFGIFNWGTVRKNAVDALDYIGSTVSPSALVSDLTFADKQMVEIAKAVRVATQSGHDPLIILDEPTSVLEKADIEKLEHEIQRLKAIGSVIFVSHRLDEIRRNCDRVYVLRAGEIVAECQASDLQDDNLFSLMTGREKAHREPKPRRAEYRGVPLLEISRGASNGHFMDLDLTIEKGQVHVIVGTRNSGREELSRSLFGLEAFSSGSIRLSGTPYVPKSIRAAISNGIGYLPAERKSEGMVSGMSVKENMMLAHPEAMKVGMLQNRRRETDTAKDWIERLDIRPKSSTGDIAGLSGGNQQKVVLAKWAKADNLQLLILDHPTRGVDPGAREHINELIDQLCEKGVGILLLADTLEEALMLGHTISVMRDGKISAVFDCENEPSPTMASLVKYMI